jgi:hypothetical protein
MPVRLGGIVCGLECGDGGFDPPEFEGDESGLTRELAVFRVLGARLLEFSESLGLVTLRAKLSGESDRPRGSRHGLRTRGRRLRWSKTSGRGWRTQVERGRARTSEKTQGCQACDRENGKRNFGHGKRLAYVNDDIRNR